MLSRRAEERNEKIIRGLMKLPHNRRCINCNTSGPQYVCTNFWTFVCMICSGIHREFTHRVKSVSMSKFTSQEVEALQRGGNQLARETFLSDWDPQRQRFPNGSNADKVREFIKNVYVDRRFSGGKTREKPPRILQDHKSHGDMTKRFISCHSYSQSPPYDHQYEERCHGKQVIALIRKSGSDRSLKSSGSFTPGHFLNPLNEEKFAVDHSDSRSSNYSTSSASSPYRSNNQSPYTQRGIKFSSFSSETSREFVNMWNQKLNNFSDTNTILDECRAPHQQRTASFSSFASFSSSSMSSNSVNSENASGTSKSTTCLPLPSSSVSGSHDSPESTVFASQTVTSFTSDSDLFQPPEMSPNLPIDLFQQSSMSLIPTASCPEMSLASQPLSLDQKSSAATLNEKSLDLVNQQNCRWATFDGPQSPELSLASQPLSSYQKSSMETLNEMSPDLVNQENCRWATFDRPQSMEPSPELSLASQPLSSDQKSSMETLNETSPDLVNPQNCRWATFDGPQSMEPSQGSQSFTGAAITFNEGGWVGDTDQHLFQNTSQQWNSFYDYSDQVTYPSMPVYWHGSQHNSVTLPSQAGALLSTTNRISTNPFDITYESDVELSNMFPDARSIQGVLPNSQMCTAFGNGVTDPWFTQCSMATYVPTGSQGTFGLFGSPVPNTQLVSVPLKEPVSPIGGNPFA